MTENATANPIDELEIKLELKVVEVNSILQALSKLPFEQVAGVIEKIRSQGDPQVSEYTGSLPKEVPEA